MQIKNKATVKLNASNKTVGLVVARFNNDITKALLECAFATLKECKVKEQNITVIEVAGSMEIPFALQLLAKQKKYDCLVALGCVIRGETPHFDYVCKMAQEGALRVSLDFHIPIGFGVITVNNTKQAQARKHIGGEATIAALELATLG